MSKSPNTAAVSPDVRIFGQKSGRFDMCMAQFYCFHMPMITQCHIQSYKVITIYVYHSFWGAQLGYPSTQCEICKRDPAIKFQLF